MCPYTLLLFFLLSTLPVRRIFYAPLPPSLPLPLLHPDKKLAKCSFRAGNRRKSRGSAEEDFPKGKKEKGNGPCTYSSNPKKFFREKGAGEKQEFYFSRPDIPPYFLCLPASFLIPSPYSFAWVIGIISLPLLPRPIHRHRSQDGGRKRQCSKLVAIVQLAR